MKTDPLLRWAVLLALAGLLCLSCLTGRALEVLPAPDPWGAAHAYRVHYPLAHPAVPRIFAVGPTGSMWPALRAGDVAVLQAGEPRPGDAAVFLYRPTARERALGAREGYRLHFFIGKAGGRYIFRAIEGVNRPHAWRETCLPTDYVGVVRKAWRLSSARP